VADCEKLVREGVRSYTCSKPNGHDGPCGSRGDVPGTPYIPALSLLPNEKLELLAALAHAWLLHPRWRFGQLLVNLSTGCRRDVFYVTNDDLRDAARKDGKA